MATDVDFRPMANDSVDGMLRNVPRFAVWPTAEAFGQRVIAAAEQGDWAFALRILGQRNQLIEHFFAEPVTEDEAPAVASAVQKTLDVDGRLRSLADGGRTDLQDKLQSLRMGRKARHAYFSKT